MALIKLVNIRMGKNIEQMSQKYLQDKRRKIELQINQNLKQIQITNKSLDQEKINRSLKLNINQLKMLFKNYLHFNGNNKWLSLKN